MGACGSTLLVAAPFAGLVANVLVQLMLCRLSPAHGHLRLQFYSIGVGALVTLGAIILIGSRTGLSMSAWLDHGLTNFCSYLFMSFCFFNIVSSTFGSLRVRMLREYLRIHPKPLAVSELQRRYSAAQMLDVRLERLIRGAQIERRGDRYYARTGIVHYIGMLFLSLQTLLMSRRRSAKRA